MWTAARRQQRTTRVARVGLLAAVVVTVAGLLAMHALSLHGTRAGGEHASLSLPAVHVDHSHALDHAEHGSTAPADHPGGEGHAAMMMCVAFLLAAGVLLLSGLWRRTPVWWFRRALSWSHSTVSPPRATHPATGPPSAWAYSVIRC
ncbi:DUF6153 family protein [Nocardioides sp. CCNWLW239]|uniref:DUF6153 family protein n=1 Tax=Nocardioides sp. CCNWLW239 TaxID=3128902 RepID=UPI00301A4D78